MTDYSDLSMFDGNDEELPGGGLSHTTKAYKLLTPGLYVSPSREIKVQKIPNGENAGHLRFSISLVGGIYNPSDPTKMLKVTYPLTKTITTVPYEGRTGVGDYLQSCGVNPAGMTLQDVVQAMQDSQNIPVQIYLGRTDKMVKDETGQWTGGKMRTKDFLQVDGTYVDSLVVNGVVFNAKETISSFSALK